MQQPAAEDLEATVAPDPRRTFRYVRLPLDVSKVASAEELVQWGSLGAEGELLPQPEAADCSPGGPSAFDSPFSRSCRIVAVSDTHDCNDHLPRPLPRGDLLVHCGDFSNTGSDAEFSRFDYWLSQAAAGGFGDRIFCVAGNHDGPKKRHGSTRANFLPNGNLLEAQLAKQRLCPRGLRLYGISWAGNCKALPEEPPVDVLLTHGPPYGILDANVGGHPSGDLSLNELLNRSVPPRLHLFGHIHEAYGARLCHFERSEKLGQPSLLLNVSNATAPVDWVQPPYLAYPVTVIDIELPP